ncbi:MAG TPA: nuclear transport factor 2 family protein, partial [Chthoniobacter sp.]|nr:nuclear transport factor 2 family protein [Chthoniobacter sp.]
SLLAFLTVFTAAPGARADEATDKAQLTEIEKQSATALVSADFQLLGSIFAEDWILVGPAGEVMTRRFIFEQLRSGDLKFTGYELGDMEIRIFGDTAVVVGRGTPRGEWNGQKFEEKEVFSDTFTRVGGKWRCVMSHSSEIPTDK